jgi:hypothetical protein
VRNFHEPRHVALSNFSLQARLVGIAIGDRKILRTDTLVPSTCRLAPPSITIASGSSRLSDGSFLHSCSRDGREAEVLPQLRCTTDLGFIVAINPRHLRPSRQLDAKCRSIFWPTGKVFHVSERGLEILDWHRLLTGGIPVRFPPVERVCCNETARSGAHEKKVNR